MDSTVDNYVFRDLKSYFTSPKELSAKTILNMIETDKSLIQFRNIPPRLHLYLMEICILNLFGEDYDATIREIILPHSMAQLLHHWPYEDFILKQLVPYLPHRLPPRYRDLCVKIKDGIMESVDRQFGSIFFLFTYVLWLVVRCNI